MEKILLLKFKSRLPYVMSLVTLHCNEHHLEMFFPKLTLILRMITVVASE